MPSLSILTPTYRPDLTYLTDHHRSIQRYTNSDVTHHLIVPQRDMSLFSRLRSNRTVIHGVNEFLPAHFLRTYALASSLTDITKLFQIPTIHAINLRRPWPPIRGWILQQITKLAAAASLDTDVVLVTDSDAVLIRHLSATDFILNGTVRLYRKPYAIHSSMTQHLSWHDTARQLLGLPAAPAGAQPDYIGGMLAWSPPILRKLHKRLEEVNGVHWTTAVSSQLQFSESTLYGIFVENLASTADRSFISSDVRCRTYFGAEPMDDRIGLEFLKAVTTDDLAILIQSNSKTPVAIRRRVIAQAQGSTTVQHQL